VLPEPSWLTPTVLQLANAIDEERQFDLVPILADALEDAGCTDAQMLDHCRRSDKHVAGCWAIDLVLRKD
jgi:hypothetical protein